MTGESGFRRWAGLLLSLGTIAAASSGCIVVEATNSPPYVADALVQAGWDNYYGECYWDVYAWVDDPNGYEDVWGVSVDFVDLVYGGIAASFDLAYDGGGQWSNLIYETYAGYADCMFPDDFGFDIQAWDSQGQTAVLSF